MVNKFVRPTVIKEEIFWKSQKSNLSGRYLIITNNKVFIAKRLLEEYTQLAA